MQLITDSQTCMSRPPLRPMNPLLPAVGAMPGTTFNEGLSPRTLC